MPQPDNQLSGRFGLTLRQLREAHGWSQEHLAEVADLNRSYVGEVERGRAVPSLLTVEKLAVALGIRLSAMLAQCETIQNQPVKHPS